MDVTFDAFGSQDEAFDFSPSEIGVLDQTQKIHDLGLIMKIVHDLRISGRRQTEQNIRVGRQYLGQLLDDFRAWWLSDSNREILGVKESRC